MRRKRIQYWLQHLPLDVVNCLGSDNYHPADQFTQGQIRYTAAVKKIERVLGFARASLNRIGVEQIAHIWSWD